MSVHNLALYIEPVPAARPRVTRRGFAYYPAKYRNFKVALGRLIRAQWGMRERLLGPLTVVIRVYCKRPRTSKLSMPRPDVDNYAKAVLDAANKVIWGDDSQVHRLLVEKAWVTDVRQTGGHIDLEVEQELPF